VGGNHDFWAKLLTGVAYFQEVLRDINPAVIYDHHQLDLTVHVGECKFNGMLRHKWRGSSIYNPTHGQERALRWEGGEIDFADGAHTHVSGVARGFNIGERSCMAIQIGAYKRIDAYAEQEGFPTANNSTGVAVVFDDETGTMTGFESLEFASRFMRSIYGTNNTESVQGVNDGK